MAKIFQYSRQNRFQMSIFAVIKDIMQLWGSFLSKIYREGPAHDQVTTQLKSINCFAGSIFCLANNLQLVDSASNSLHLKSVVMLLCYTAATALPRALDKKKSSSNLTVIMRSTSVGIQKTKRILTPVVQKQIWFESKLALLYNSDLLLKISFWQKARFRHSKWIISKLQMVFLRNFLPFFNLRMSSYLETAKKVPTKKLVQKIRDIWRFWIIPNWSWIFKGAINAHSEP